MSGPEQSRASLPDQFVREVERTERSDRPLVFSDIHRLCRSMIGIAAAMQVLVRQAGCAAVLLILKAMRDGATAGGNIGAVVVRSDDNAQNLTATAVVAAGITAVAIMAANCGGEAGGRCSGDEGERESDGQRARGLSVHVSGPFHGLASVLVKSDQRELPDERFCICDCEQAMPSFDGDKVSDCRLNQS
jgi:hypothetical protein